jgi:hypothetical protein
MRKSIMTGARNGKVVLKTLPFLLLALILGLSLSAVLNTATPIFAATSGPLNAGAGANVTGIGAVAWANASNIQTPGSPYATYSGTNTNPNNVSQYLQGTTYGFSIPADSTIDGIQVTINRNGTRAGLINNEAGIYDNAVYLVKNGNIQTSGDNKAKKYFKPTCGPQHLLMPLTEVRVICGEAHGLPQKLMMQVLE